MDPTNKQAEEAADTLIDWLSKHKDDVAGVVNLQNTLHGIRGVALRNLDKDKAERLPFSTWRDKVIEMVSTKTNGRIKLSESSGQTSSMSMDNLYYRDAKTPEEAADWITNLLDKEIG